MSSWPRFSSEERRSCEAPTATACRSPTMSPLHSSATGPRSRSISRTSRSSGRSSGSRSQVAFSPTESPTWERTSVRSADVRTLRASLDRGGRNRQACRQDCRYGTCREAARRREESRGRRDGARGPCRARDGQCPTNARGARRSSRELGAMQHRTTSSPLRSRASRRWAAGVVEAGSQAPCSCRTSSKERASPQGSGLISSSSTAAAQRCLRSPPTGRSPSSVGIRAPTSQPDT